MNPLICFRAAGTLLAALDERSPGDGRSLVAKRDLERYYATLRAELAGVDLSEAEASAVVDAANGTLFDPPTARLLWAEVDDAVRLNGLDRKWAVDGRALVEKLRSLTASQTLAVADACERFWSAVGAGEEVETASLLRRVGLVRGADRPRARETP